MELMHCITFFLLYATFLFTGSTDRCTQADLHPGNCLHTLLSACNCHACTSRRAVQTLLIAVFMHYIQHQGCGSSCMLVVLVISFYLYLSVSISRILTITYVR